MEIKYQEQVKYISEDSIFLKSEILDLLNQIQKIRPELSELEFYDNQIYHIDFIAKNSKKNQNSMLSIFQKYRLNQKTQHKIGNRIKGQDYIMTFQIEECFETDQFLIQETEYSEYLRRNKIYRLEDINQYTKDIIRILVINKSDCNIRDQKALTISSTIGLCKNLSTLKIELGLNEIGCNGAGQFLQNISECKNLNKLFLSFSFGKSKYSPWCNQIRQQGAEGLGLGFQQLTSIQCLTIDFDKQPLEKGCAALFKGISKCRNIINLNISLNQCQIDGNGIQELANLIGECQNLSQLQLKLKNNYITKQGAWVILKSVKSSQSLFHFCLEQYILFNEDYFRRSASNLLKKSRQLVVFKLA